MLAAKGSQLTPPQACERAEENERAVAVGNPVQDLDHFGDRDHLPLGSVRNRSTLDPARVPPGQFVVHRRIHDRLEELVSLGDGGLSDHLQAFLAPAPNVGFLDAGQVVLAESRHQVVFEESAIEALRTWPQHTVIDPLLGKDLEQHFARVGIEPLPSLDLRFLQNEPLAFELDEGAPVYERARLVKEGDTPTHTLTSYYRPEDVEGTPLVDPTPGPAGRGGGFAVLTMQGLEPDSMTENFHARMPTREEIDLLQLPAGEPVMILHRKTFTREGRIVEFARGVHAASRFAWSYSFKIPE